MMRNELILRPSIFKERRCKLHQNAFCTFFVILNILGIELPLKALDLNSIESWTYQLQDADPQLIASDPSSDLVVIDYAFYGDEASRYSSEDIQRIKDSGKIVLAYFSIGEAEEYRFYWQEEWEKPISKPNFLAKENIHWPGNYLVRYWDEQWKSILFTYFLKIVSAGFDGIYVDRVDSYYEWQKLGENSVSPQLEMIKLVTEIRTWGNLLIGEKMIFVIQNGETVIDEPGVTVEDRKRLFNAIDGVATEDLFFYGDKDMDNSFNPEKYRINLLRQYKAIGKKILSVEYLSEKEKIRQFIQQSKIHDHIPLVAGRNLDKLARGVKHLENLRWLDNQSLIYNPQEFRSYQLIRLNDLAGDPVWKSQLQLSPGKSTFQRTKIDVNPS